MRVFKPLIGALLALSFIAISAPATARFVSADPVKANPNTGENFNRYSYANNNPYRFIDPDGRQPGEPGERAFAVSMGIFAPDDAYQATHAAESARPMGGVAGEMEGGRGLRDAAVAVGEGKGVKGAAVAVTAVAVAATGRGKNRLGPDSRANGAHSTLKRDSKGNITNTATYETNTKNPSGFQETKRVDVTGAPHTNPDGTKVPTPHVNEAGIKEVRPARPDEIPR